MSENVVKIQDIYKSFGDSTILKGVSLTLRKGEIKVLIGPSGGGKSTLLQCINCLTLPDSGTIALNGKVIDTSIRKDLYHLRQQVGMIFQDFNLFDHLTARQNIRIALSKVKKMVKKEALARADRELEQVGLADKGHLYPAELSGGQKQRVAIARALAMDPTVLLLDEPTSALDPDLVEEVVNVIKTMASRGMTMILATHQMSLIASLADEILFMESGCIVEQGSPAQLLDQNESKTRGFCSKISDTVQKVS